MAQENPKNNPLKWSGRRKCIGKGKHRLENKNCSKSELFQSIGSHNRANASPALIFLQTNECHRSCESPATVSFQVK